MKQFAILLLLAALTACHTDQPTVSAVVQAYEAAARRDSAKAARLDSTARVYRDLGQAYEDSATFYHTQSTHVQATAADSITLRRFFAGY